MIKVIIQIKHSTLEASSSCIYFAQEYVSAGIFVFSMNSMERESAMVPNGELDHTFRCENNFLLKDNMQQSLFCS